MNDEALVQELEHLYRDAEETHMWELGQVGKNVNELADIAKENHPDDSTIQEIEEVPSRTSAHSPDHTSTIKRRIRELARALGADMETFGEEESPDDSAPDTVVHVGVNQHMAVSVDIDVVIERVEDPELQGYMRAFKQEVDGEKPDESRLEDLYSKAYGMSATIAPHLFLYAAENGIDLLMNNLG